MSFNMNGTGAPGPSLFPEYDHGYSGINQNPSIQVESLSLPELMKNHHVQTMYNQWKDASNQVIQAAQMQQALWQENCRLTAEVNALQSNSL
jgi:hypothetical protein